jgi:hypothetical protein
MGWGGSECHRHPRRKGAITTLVTYGMIEQPGRAIKINRTPDTWFGAGLNRRLDCGKCSTPRGLRQLPQWVDGAPKTQPKKITWAGEVLSAGAIPSEVLRMATGPNERDDSSSLLGDQDNSDLGHLGWY